jgi:hypothetical protein
MLPKPAGSERGQATVEYAGLLLFVALALSGFIAFAPAAVPGAELARTLAARLVCSVGGGGCAAAAAVPPLEDAYGPELAALIEAHRPEIRFEPGPYSSLPVDFRRCRLRRCADTTRLGSIGHSQAGEQPTAFVHVVDCRPEASPPPPEAACDGEAAGRLYLQYWLYYPDSATRTMGAKGYHADDWESLQVRIGEGGTDARASAHHGYAYEGGLGSALAEAGIRGSPGWGPALGYLWVSEGSHAGRAKGGLVHIREIPSEQLRVIPLDPLVAAGLDDYGFAVSPPWEKAVWSDPESTST